MFDNMNSFAATLTQIHSWSTATNLILEYKKVKKMFVNVQEYGKNAKKCAKMFKIIFIFKNNKN